MSTEAIWLEHSPSTAQSWVRIPAYAFTYTHYSIFSYLLALISFSFSYTHLHITPRTGTQSPLDPLTREQQGTLRMVLHLSECLVIVITLVLLTSCDIMGPSYL